MLVTLFNKNVPLADIEVEHNYQSMRLQKVHNVDYMPIGMLTDGKLNEALLFAWWKGRMIPASRENIRDLLADLSVDTREELYHAAFGLSLSDQYWMKPAGLDVTWEDVNFFTNDFSSYVGKVMFDEEIDVPASLISPNNSSDGWLRKKWVVAENGERYLFKGGSKPFFQEAFNEVIATEILKYSQVFYQPYHLADDGNNYFSVCKNFINENTEFVPAYYIYRYLPQGKKVLSGREKMEHLLNCCAALNIEGADNMLNDMLILDYLIVNTDRHWGNFGFIRDVNSLEFVGCAPIFDSGSSLWYDTVHPQPFDGKAKTFNAKHRDQIKLVQDFTQFDLGMIWEKIPACMENLFKRNRNFDAKRVHLLVNSFRERLLHLEQIV